MRTGAAAGHVGCFHETAFYGSDEEYLALVVPYLRDAVAAGEPVYVTCSEKTGELLRRGLPSLHGITMIPGSTHLGRPAVVVRIYRDAFAKDVAAGATAIRVLAEVPHPGLGVPWDAWRRYEAATNVVYDEFPVWGLCPYDLRTAPETVVADARRTHPMVASADGGHHPNPQFVEPAAFAHAHRPATDPLEQRAPAIVLADPSSGQTRRWVREAARTTELADDAIEDLITAASEGVANALQHGQGSVALRVWTSAHRIVVTVHDQGDGPPDPFAGLLVPSEEGGYGLWIIHQLVDNVVLDRSPTGFTLRMEIGL